MNAKVPFHELERELAQCETRLGQLLLARHGALAKRPSTMPVLERIAGLEETTVDDPSELEELLGQLARAVLAEIDGGAIEDPRLRDLVRERATLAERVETARQGGGVERDVVADEDERATATAPLTEILARRDDPAGRDHLRNASTDRVEVGAAGGALPARPKGQATRWVLFGMAAGVAVAVVLGGVLGTDAPPPPADPRVATLAPSVVEVTPAAPTIEAEAPPRVSEEPVEPEEIESPVPAEAQAQEPTAGDAPEVEVEVEGGPDPLADALSRGDELFAQRRFLVPPRDNAFNAYRRALELDPDNLHARDRLGAIKQFYVNVSERAAGQDDLEKALLFLKRAARVDPVDSNLRLRIADVEREIARRDVEASKPAVPTFDASVPAPPPEPDPADEPEAEEEGGFFDFLF